MSDHERKLPEGTRPFENFLAGYRMAGIDFPKQLDDLEMRHQIILPAYLRSADLENGLRVECLTPQFDSCKELKKKVYHDVSKVVNAAIGHAGPIMGMPPQFRDYCVVQITVA